MAATGFSEKHTRISDQAYQGLTTHRLVCVIGPLLPHGFGEGVLLGYDGIS